MQIIFKFFAIFSGLFFLEFVEDSQARGTPAQIAALSILYVMQLFAAQLAFNKFSVFFFKV